MKTITYLTFLLPITINCVHRESTVWSTPKGTITRICSTEKINPKIYNKQLPNNDSNEWKIVQYIITPKNGNKNLCVQAVHNSYRDKLYYNLLTKKNDTLRKIGKPNVFSFTPDKFDFTFFQYLDLDFEFIEK